MCYIIRGNEIPVPFKAFNDFDFESEWWSNTASLPQRFRALSTFDEKERVKDALVYPNAIGLFSTFSTQQGLFHGQKGAVAIEEFLALCNWKYKKEPFKV